MSTSHVRPGEGRHYPMIDGDHIAKASVQDAAGAFEVFEVIAPAVPMAPPHVSPWSGVLFLLEGRVTAHVDGTSYDVETGKAGLSAAHERRLRRVIGHGNRGNMLRAVAFAPSAPSPDARQPASENASA